MKAWWALYKKEIYSMSFFTLVVVLLTLVWELFLYFKINSWSAEVAFGLSFLPLGFFPLLILWQGYNAFRQEWKDDTNYFLLAIPRRGWEITLSKMAASMSFYIVVTLFTGLIIYILHQGFIQREIIAQTPDLLLTGNLITKMIFLSFLLYFIDSLVRYILIQFSQLVSLFYDRFRGFIAIIVFVLLHYVVFRGATLLSPLFNWLPDFPVTFPNQVGMGLIQKTTIYVGSGPIIAAGLIVIGLFILGSWLLENQLEV